MAHGPRHISPEGKGSIGMGARQEVNSLESIAKKRGELKRGGAWAHGRMGAGAHHEGSHGCGCSP